MSATNPTPDTDRVRIDRVRDIVDRWEVGQLTHWVAVAEIRRIVGGINPFRSEAHGLAGTERPS